MKRVGAFIILALMIMVLACPAVFAANSGNLKLTDNYPESGTTGASIDNLSVKLYFNQDVKPANKAVKESNEAAITFEDNKGKKVPVIVKYHPTKKGQVIVLADATSGASSKKGAVKIKSNTKYTVTIGKAFKATNGDTMSEDQVISFTTIDQGQASKIQFLMMGAMVVVMVVVMVRSGKKEEEKEKEKKKKAGPVNPYKVAKKTGKSVEDVVKKDEDRKAKRQAAEEKRKAKEEKLRSKYGYPINEIASDNKRVSRPRPISEGGSTYRHFTASKKNSAKQQQKTTRPKNQSGKQKNTKSKNKSKKNKK
ncbi:MAG: hypothetical protein IKS63_01310 [Firmicutes bacterium]|nr:hypothetical protein [Bacillota bacterium]